MANPSIGQMQPKVTVLVAVYNAERFLRKCMDSLCNQTLKDIQIVCVDDCSQDHSLSIINDYAAHDSRIRILQTEHNSGQAVARNMGLAIAEGQYITMLDSDDWYAPWSLESAYTVAMSAGDIDCAMFRLVLHDDETGAEEDYKLRTDDKIMSGYEAFRLSLDWGVHGLYLVKASIHKQYPFDTSCRLYSDDNATRLHYLHSRKVAVTDAPYYYRKHAASMTNAISIRRFDCMEAGLSMKRQLEREARAGSINDGAGVLQAFETSRWINVVGCYGLYRRNAESFTADERAEIRRRIAVILKTIDRGMVSPRIKYKFGYFPFKSPVMFTFVEDVYFFMRGIVYRLCGRRQPL